MTHGKVLIKASTKGGLRVKKGKGDHFKVYAPVGRGYMVIPNDELAKGTEHAIRKWLKAAGVIVALFILGAPVAVVVRAVAPMLGF